MAWRHGPLGDRQHKSSSLPGGNWTLRNKTNTALISYCLLFLVVSLSEGRTRLWALLPKRMENVGKPWLIPERIIRQSPELAKLRPFSAPCSVTVFSSFFDLGHHSQQHFVLGMRSREAPTPPPDLPAVNAESSPSAPDGNHWFAPALLCLARLGHVIDMGRQGPAVAWYWQSRYGNS